MRWTLIILILAFTASCGSHRLSQSSQKKRPYWLHGIEQGQIIALGTASTHEAARERAMTAVRDQVVNAIAVQVISNTTMTTEEERRNDVSKFIDNFENTIDVNSEYFNALKGISVSRVSDFYWEERGRGNEKQIVYHIKYPFSEIELRGLIADYERYDREIGSQIEAVENRTNYDSVEQILENINKVNYLIDIAGNEKKKRARGLKNKLEYMLSDIRIERIEDRPGFVRYSLSLYDRPIATRQTPDIFASCSIEVSKVTAFPQFYEVDYTFERCNLKDRQHITIAYNFDGYRTERNFYFTK